MHKYLWKSTLTYHLKTWNNENTLQKVPPCHCREILLIFAGAKKRLFLLSQFDEFLVQLLLRSGLGR